MGSLCELAILENSNANPYNIEDSFLKLLFTLVRPDPQGMSLEHAFIGSLLYRLSFWILTKGVLLFPKFSGPSSSASPTIDSDADTILHPCLKFVDEDPEEFAPLIPQKISLYFIKICSLRMLQFQLGHLSSKLVILFGWLKEIISWSTRGCGLLWSNWF